MKRLPILIALMLASLPSVTLAQDGFYREGERVSEFTTGADGQVISWIRGDAVTTVNRDANGLLTSMIDPSGHRIDLNYDEAGMVTSYQDRTLGVVLTLINDPLHHQPTIVQWDNDAGIQTRIDYDARGNPISVTSPEGRRLQATFLPNGLIDTVTDERGLAITATYGASGQLTAVQRGSGADQRGHATTYDSAGRLTTSTMDDLGVSQYTYHSSGRLQSATTPGGDVLTFDYDGNDWLTSARLPGGVTHRWEPDGLGRIARYAPPGVPALDYTYSVHSDLTELSAEGIRYLDIDYDDHGQPTTIAFHEPSASPLTVTRTYNAQTTLLTEAESSDGIGVRTTYRGNTVSKITWTDAVQGSFSIIRDNRARVQSTQLNGEAPVAFTYDHDNLVLSAAELTFTRRASDGLVERASIGILTETYAYNDFGEVIGHVVAAGASPLFEASYTRDRAGRITSAQETIAGTVTNFAFRYDANNRLSQVLTNGVVSERYQYDSRGNLLSDGYVSNDADQLVSAGGATFTYSPAGMRDSLNTAAGTTRYHYTATAELRRVELADGRIIDYQHDAFLNRTGKRLNGAIVRNYLCPVVNVPIAELDAANNILARYIYATRAIGPELMLKAGETFRLVTDHTGSVRFVVNTATGAIAQEKRYDAYGRTLSDSAPGFQPFGFAGGWTDPDTGLIRFGLRDYDPEFRSWTSRDPLQLASGDPNFYAYVYGDPVNWIDVLGSEPARIGTERLPIYSGPLDLLRVDDYSPGCETTPDEFDPRSTPQLLEKVASLRSKESNLQFRREMENTISDRDITLVFVHDTVRSLLINGLRGGGGPKPKGYISTPPGSSIPFSLWHLR